MKSLLNTIFLGLLSVFLVTGTALALPFGDGGAALQGVLDKITVGPIAGDSSVDVTTDYVKEGKDSFWAISGAGGSLATMIIELADFAPNNSFGVFSGSDYVELFSGGDAAGAQALLSIKFDGSVHVNFGDTGVDFAANRFGFYLDSSAYTNGGLWHSDTSLNADGADHLLAYQGTGVDTVQLPGLAAGLWTAGEFVFAFEDLDASVSDWDFTDMVVMVESVNPIPEPSVMLLVGTGLFGVAVLGRKKLFRNV